jgi:hypothetical protein
MDHHAWLLPSCYHTNACLLHETMTTLVLHFLTLDILPFVGHNNWGPRVRRLSQLPWIQKGVGSRGKTEQSSCLPVTPLPFLSLSIQVLPTYLAPQAHVSLDFFSSNPNPKTFDVLDH